MDVREKVLAAAGRVRRNARAVIAQDLALVEELLAMGLSYSEAAEALHRGGAIRQPISGKTLWVYVRELRAANGAAPAAKPVRAAAVRPVAPRAAQPPRQDILPPPLPQAQPATAPRAVAEPTPVQPKQAATEDAGRVVNLDNLGLREPRKDQFKFEEITGDAAANPNPPATERPRLGRLM